MTLSLYIVVFYCLYDHDSLMTTGYIWHKNCVSYSLIGCVYCHYMLHTYNLGSVIAIGYNVLCILTCITEL